MTEFSSIPTFNNNWKLELAETQSVKECAPSSKQTLNGDVTPPSAKVSLDPVCYGRLKDLEIMVPSQWWKTVFADAMYLKTDGDVIEDPEITREEIALLESDIGIKAILDKGLHNGKSLSKRLHVQKRPPRFLICVAAKEDIRSIWQTLILTSKSMDMINHPILFLLPGKERKLKISLHKQSFPLETVDKFHILTTLLISSLSWEILLDILRMIMATRKFWMKSCACWRLEVVSLLISRMVDT